MNKDVPNILLVNPWICDFAAYDFWAKPIGLLTLASILRCHGFSVYYIDCLDRFHPKAAKTDPLVGFGRGHYLKTTIARPESLSDVQRKYSRYGIKTEWFKEYLLSIPKPDLVLVTSIMTYWYKGVQEAIKIIKEIFPDTRIVLGGIYANLCHDHAVAHSGADSVASGPGTYYILKLAEKHTGFSAGLKYTPEDLDSYPYPAFDLQHKINYITVCSSIGCPFSCTYCASRFLNPRIMLRSPESVVDEIKYWHDKYMVNDFVFYDDALLVNSETHAIPILEKIIQTGMKLRFHTPNAVHIREISPKIARLMHKAGFKTLRLGLETAAFEKRKDFDDKVSADEFTRAAACLKDAGFTKNQVGAYLLAGLPGQTTASIENSIRIVLEKNITPVIAYYSPIPHTVMWGKAVKSSRYDLEADPVFTNNSILPCQQEPFSWKKISYLKNLAAS